MVRNLNTYSMVAQDKKNQQLAVAHAHGYIPMLRERGHLRQTTLKHKWYTMHVFNDTKNKELAAHTHTNSGIKTPRPIKAYNPGVLPKPVKQEITLKRIDPTGAKIKITTKKVTGKVQNGLALTKEDNGLYSLVHVKSGKSILDRIDLKPKKAEALLEYAAAKTDWKQSEKKIAVPKTKSIVREITDKSYQMRKEYY
jgi:hypothetical protein